jgi:hypothetical protein
VGDLDCWHFGIYRIVWRDHALGRDFVTFRLDPKGEPIEPVSGLEDRLYPERIMGVGLSHRWQEP